ncbi:MAG: hypothetical protein EPN38_04015 [Rhodanobacteraceae bacterium]|nr:MAG: hypothetical protein EPN38_04015 [Rhodanobacteraceae bacterium]
MKIRKVWMAGTVLGGVLCCASALGAPSPTCQRYGEIAFAAWTQGLYGAVGQHFSAEVKIHLSPSVLHAMWQQLVAQAGKFESLGRFVPRTLDGHAMMAAPMKFQAMNMAAVFACNPKDQIVGLQILDPAQVPALRSLDAGLH